jgi:hypothetical protein
MRIETINRSIEEFEIEARLILSSSFMEREFVFCRETPIRQYLLSHYGVEDLRDLFETYNAYIEKYVSSITRLVLKECRALGFYRRPISLSILKALVEKSIKVLQIEKKNKRGPKRRKESKSAYSLHKEHGLSPQTRGGDGPRGAGARTGAGPVRAGDPSEG